MGNAAQHCRLRFCHDSDFARDQTTWGGVLCTFGNRTTQGTSKRTQASTQETGVSTPKYNKMKQELDQNMYLSNVLH